MRNKFNPLNVLLVFLTLSFFVTACSDKEEDFIENSFSLNEPAIALLSPESGVVGTIISIKGTGFGTDVSKVKVRFSTTEVTSIISVTDTLIQVEAPGGFFDRASSVRVFVSNAASNR